MGYEFVFAIIFGATSSLIVIYDKSTYKKEPTKLNKVMYISSLVMVPVFIATGYMVGNSIGR